MDGVVGRPQVTKKDSVPPKAKKVIVDEAPVVTVVDAPIDHYFWVHQGGVLRNLRDLLGALESMSDEQFAFHTKREGNDFANWIREIFHEEGLADRLARTRTRSGCIKAVREVIGE